MSDKTITIGLQPFLPESWISDPARLGRARVAEERRGYRSKPEIALAKIDRVRGSALSPL